MKQKRTSIYVLILTAVLLTGLLFGMVANAAVPSIEESTSEGQPIISSSEIETEPSSEEEISQSEEEGASLQPSSSDVEPTSQPEDSIPKPESGLELQIEDLSVSSSQTSLPQQSDISSSFSAASSLPQSKPPVSAALPTTFAAEDLVEINATTAEVYTYAALKTAIELPQYTTVLLGQDIEQTVATGNIKIAINKTKPSFFLDGQGHTFTQLASASIERTISVEAGNTVTKNVVVKNMNVIGANYWGLVYIGPANVILTLEEINYNGPQPAYNPTGTARFINSAFELVERGTTSQEIAEAAHVELGGTVTIAKKTILYSLFWLKGASTSLTVLPNANVNIDTEFYFIYADASYPAITIGENAILNLTTKQGFTWDAQSIDKLVLEENANLNITQNADRGFSGMYIRNLLHAKPGSQFSLIRKAGTRPSIEMLTTNAQVIFDKPKHVTIFSHSSWAFLFTYTGKLSITANTINRWKTAAWPVPEQISNAPQFIWNKAGDEPVSLIAQTNNTGITSVSHNLTIDDPTPADAPLNAENINIRSTKLFTFGEIPLSIDTVSNLSTSVQGGTWPSAVLQANYTTEELQPAVLNGGANENGRYNLPLPKDTYAEKGTTLTVVSFANTLAVRKSIIVQGEEKNKLKFVALPETLPFANMPLPNSAALIGREDINWHIKVQDSRPNRSPWRVNAAAQSPLTATVNGQTHTLPNALVFVDEQNVRTPLNEDLVTVFSYEAETPSEFVDVAWGEKTGLMLWVPPGAAQSEAVYSSAIQWFLTDAP